MTVEGHPAFRHELELFLASQQDMDLVGYAGGAKQAIVQYRRLKPDIVLMDQGLRDASGAEISIEIRKRFPNARIIMITDSKRDLDTQRVLRAGVAAYMLKTVSKDELLRGIRIVSRGRKYSPPVDADAPVEHRGQEGLTAREMEVLSLIREGTKNKEIAKQLGISETTVNFHIRNIVAKLQAKDRVHAVALAIRRGLIEI